jgi:rubrerythrin
VEVKTLQHHIATLATLKETDAPVLSCYLSLEKGPRACQDVLAERVQTLRKSLPERERMQLDTAFGSIEAYLRESPVRGNIGLALFSRAGARPFFLPLEFRIPLPTGISLNATPNIYRLVELKDNYDRYVVIFATEESARILAIDLGSITQEAWKTRPGLRRSVGNEWTREHYQDHRREGTRQFIREQIRIADHLISAGGYGHLILAGPARMTAGIRQALPKHLLAKLVDVVSASAADRLSDVVAATLQPFLEHEESESLAMVDRLLKEIRTHGLAVAGTSASMTALRAQRVDVLVVAKDYQPGEGWGCLACSHTQLESKSSETCPKCHGDRLRQFEIKEEMVRLAERFGCMVEVVDHSDPLMQLGGVGCLLRYAASTNYCDRAA